MAEEPWTVLKLRAGSLAESDVVVEQISGEEGLSTPFQFDVAFRSPAADPPLNLHDLIAAESLIVMQRPGGDECRVHGVFSSIALTGLVNSEFVYQARLVPAFALLEHTRGSRIFQTKSVPDIVKEVLDARGIRFRLALTSSYLQREFCVQYQESDLAFVSRLLEEEGIFYFFEHTDDHETLVLADSVNACPSIVGEKKLPFRDRAPTADVQQTEHVFELEHALRERPGKATLRDFDFTRPALDLTASAEVAADAAREMYAYPGGYTAPTVGKRLAKVRLESYRGGIEGFSGQSTCMRLTAGSTCEVSDHAEETFNASLLLVRVLHDARQGARAGSATPADRGYRNRFVAALSSAPYRPPCRTARPQLLGTQTAIVVGPSGEEIFPDKYGRIKIQFHWDRNGKSDDHSSCFIRLAEDWAGAGFGQSVIPRLGQEVVVRFLDGDPDRPLVVGAVYNGSHTPPLNLPGERSQATTRSDSSPGGGGSNELHFEDNKGQEQILIHAQRDESIAVVHDKDQQVGANESLQVTKDRARKVGNNQTLRVESNDSSEVKGSFTLNVAGNRQSSISADDSESVAGLAAVTVGGSSTVLVETISEVDIKTSATLGVGGVYQITVGAAFSQTVDGDLSRKVAGSHKETVGISRAETIEGNASSAMAAAFDETVQGAATAAITKDSEETYDAGAEISIQGPLTLLAKVIQLEANTFTLKVNGNVAWQIAQSGAVTVAGNNVTVTASSDITMKGSKIQKD